MTFYAHLNLLSAVIMGLAVVKLLQGLVWMIHGRQRIKVYWVHLVWIVNVILLQFTHYWHLGNLRNNMNGESWRGFADMLVTPIFAYLVAVLLFPPSGEDRPVDLRDFYYENHAWIFGAFAGVALVNAGFLGAIVNQPLELETILGRYPPVLLLGALAVTRNKWYHMAMAILVLLGMPFAIFAILN